MVRGLPYSLLLHTLALVLVVMFGNRVARAPIQPSRAIPFQLTYQSRPQAEPAASPSAAEAPPQEQPQEAAPPQVEPDLPPKELPAKKPETKPETKPRTEPVTPVRPRESRGADRTPAAGEPAPGAGATAALGPSVGSTDTDFPFAWYLTRIEGLIARNWNPRQLGFGQRALVSCSVHFVIARNGAVSGVNLTAGSGVGVYDREALRAVETTRLPPLPPQFPGGSLGVTFVFNLEPGS